MVDYVKSYLFTQFIYLNFIISLTCYYFINLLFINKKGLEKEG